MILTSFLYPALIASKMCVKNPVSLHLRFLWNLMSNQRRFRGYRQGYMAHVSECECESNVTVCDGVEISSSQVGRFTYIARGTRISRCQIGGFCSIGPDCRIGLGTHPASVFVSTSPVFFSTGRQAGETFADQSYFEETKPIKIGNDVWIGAGATVLDGIIIGNGVIIAAGAVVTRDVPPYSIVGGVPAKLIRFRFSPDVIRRVSELRWWDKDEAWLRSHFRLFHSVDLLLESLQMSEDLSEVASEVHEFD